MGSAQEASLAAVLTRLKDDARAYFGVHDVELFQERLIDRPFSTVARVRVRLAGDDTDRCLYAKVMKPRSSVEAAREYVAADYEVNRRAYLEMRSHEDLGAVPPVACYPDLLALVTEEVKGPTLLSHLNTEATWFVPAGRIDQLRKLMRSAGHWIRVFQSSGARTGNRITIDGLRDYVDVRLGRLVERTAGRFSPSDRSAILRHIERLGSQVSPEELAAVPVHADLSLGNVIVSDRRIVVLDFAMAGSGGRLQDVSRLFLQLEMLGLKPYFRAAVVRALQAALLAGFDPSLDDRQPLFRIHLLLHRVNNLGKLMLEPGAFPSSVYDGLARRAHRRRIAEELRG